MQKSKNALDIRAFQRLVVLDTSRHLIQDVDGSQNDALPVLREGTGPMSTVERHESVNVLRLQRFKAGETADEIARSDGVTIETVLYSIRRAAEREQMLIH